MSAELTRIDIRKVVASRTAADGTLDFDNRFGKLGCVGGRHLKHEKRQPLRRLGPDTRKLFKLIDQPIDGFRNIGHQNRPGILRPPVKLPICPARASSTLRIPSLTAATTRSCNISLSPPVNTSCSI